MMRRGTPEADLQRAVVQALRIALPRSAIIHHCANEVTEAGPRGAKRQAILVGMGVHAGKDRLALRPAGPGLGHLVGAVMDDGGAGQGDPQRLHHGALKIGLGRTTAHHRGALP